MPNQEDQVIIYCSVQDYRGAFHSLYVSNVLHHYYLLRKKPEIRYAKTAADSQYLHQIQLAILNAVATKVKKGGIITYSTCTLLKTENELTVREFLSSNPQFAELTTKTTKCIKDGRDARSLTILPSDYDTDGFFIATIKRLS